MLCPVLYVITLKDNGLTRIVLDLFMYHSCMQKVSGLDFDSLILWQWKASNGCLEMILIFSKFSIV